MICDYPRNFTRDELLRSRRARREGISNTPPTELESDLCRLAHYLQSIRDAIKRETDVERPIIVSSGYRTPRLNGLVKGSPTSDHVQARAADISVPGIRSYQLAQFIATHVGGYKQLINEYGDWVHVSIPLEEFEPKLELLTSEWIWNEGAKKFQTHWRAGLIDV